MSTQQRTQRSINDYRLEGCLVRLVAIFYTKKVRYANARKTKYEPDKFALQVFYLADMRFNIELLFDSEFQAQANKKKAVDVLLARYRDKRHKSLAAA